MIRQRSDKKSVASLIKEADEAFSEYVRRRDADQGGYITCVSCEARVPWRQADCCHYIDRGQMVTRYNEMNAAAGCRECNRFFPVEHKVQFRYWLIRKFGLKGVESMVRQSRSLQKWMPFELEELTDFFRKKSKELENVNYH